MMLVDTHLHLADSQFDPDRDSVIENARKAGVQAFVEIAESPASWEAAITLADRYPFIYASLGIHPHHAHEAGPAVWSTLEAPFRKWLAHPKAVAIGEFGLDYFRMRNTREEQLWLFRKHLELARELQKPVVIHCREAERPKNSAAGEGPSAHADIQEAIREFYPDKHLPMALDRPNGVIHCFSGTWSDAQTYMMHGFMLGIDAPVTYPSSSLLKENVLRMPLQRMVLETDAPYLPPQMHRGQRNEPTYLPSTAEAVASIKRKTIAEVVTSTTRNAWALFRLPGNP